MTEGAVFYLGKDGLFFLLYYFVKLYNQSYFLTRQTSMPSSKAN